MHSLTIVDHSFLCSPSTCVSVCHVSFTYYQPNHSTQCIGSRSIPLMYVSSLLQSIDSLRQQMRSPETSPCTLESILNEISLIRHAAITSLHQRILSHNCDPTLTRFERLFQVFPQSIFSLYIGHSHTATPSGTVHSRTRQRDCTNASSLSAFHPPTEF